MAIVNRFGRMAGWESISVNILGRDLDGIIAIEYSDELETELIYGAGKMPVGKGTGNYSAKGSITLLQEERLALIESLPRGSRLQDIDDFDVIISYEYGNKVFTDAIRNCSFMNNGVEVAQGDKSVSYKFDLICTHIDYNI